MKSKNDRGYWLGWYIAFGMAAMLLIFLLFRAFTVRDFACGSNETDCFRQWVSALGGWAAVAAAVPTFLYLSKQVQDARLHQRQNLEIQYRRHRAIASRARMTARECAQIADRISVVWREEDPEKFPLHDINWWYTNHNFALTDAVSDQVFDFVEDEILLTSDLTIRQIREAVTSHAPNARMGKIPVDTYGYRNLRTTILEDAYYIREWMSACASECDAFLKRTEKMIGTEQSDHD